MNKREKMFVGLIGFCLLFSVENTFANDEEDLIHGSWVSQGEWGEEFELTLHPDGTFHMLITAVGDASAEETWEDEEDYEDGGDEWGWGEFMDEFDSNDNGVLDEADFEAARESGEEDLPPSWDDALAAEEVVTLVVQVNGKMRDRFEVPANISEEEGTRLALERPNVQRHMGGKEPSKVVYVPGRLVNVVVG